MKTRSTNYINLEFLSRSANEGFARSAVACFAAQLDPTLEELGDIKTAVSEAVTNAIVHAYPDTLGRIVVKVRILEGNVLEISVRDWGRGIADVDQARQPLFTTGGEERSGMGFTIMESFMDELTVRSDQGEGDPRDDAAADQAPPGRLMTAGTLDLLLQARNGDEAAAAKALEENSGLIWAVVRRYFGKGVEADDLYQLGCLGFLKAVRGFDPAYGTQFSTYAVPKIAGEIRRYLRDNGAIKVGRSLREQSVSIYAARERLRAGLGREPALSELSEATGLTPEEIAAAELAAAPPDSLNQENADGLTLESTLASPVTEEQMLERIALRSAIDRLPDQEQKTILLRFYKGLTQQQCARILGVSQVQVSRLEKRAIEKLRREMQ